MNWCETWTIKNAKCHGTDAFKLWCWRRLLRIPRIARRSNQSIPKEISVEYSLEGHMLQLKLWYFDHLIWRADSLENTMTLGKTEGKRRRGWQRIRWLNGITVSIDRSRVTRSLLIFWGIAVLFHICCINLQSFQNAQGFHFLHPLINISNFFFLMTVILANMNWSHCSFDLHFPNNWWCWTSFHVPAGHVCTIFEKKKKFYSDSLPF